jgi:hypothetical protein
MMLRRFVTYCATHSRKGSPTGDLSWYGSQTIRSGEDFYLFVMRFEYLWNDLFNRHLIVSPTVKFPSIPRFPNASPLFEEEGNILFAALTPH